MLKFAFIQIILILSVSTLNAQESKQKYRVDFNVIKGELTPEDSYKKDFGRYDGYEIELYEGEAINIVVYSNDFQPSIALVNSNGEIFKQSTRNDKGYANLVSLIKIGGNYLLYVVGDSNSEGAYTIQTAIAERNSIELEKGADFCSTLHFLLAHATAYFFLIENPEFTKGPLVTLNGSIDSYLDEEIGSFKSSFYNGDDFTRAELSFNNLVDRVAACLGKEWHKTSKGWGTVEEYKTRTILFTEKNDSPRFLLISIIDYTNSDSPHSYKYLVDVAINREQTK